MLEALQATTTRHRKLGRLLGPMVEAHTTHIDLLAEAAPDGTAEGHPTVTPSGRPSSAVGGRTGVPGNVRRALTTLLSQEEELTVSARRHALVAESGAFARLLASMAASSAQNAAVLADAAGKAGRP